jgi:hypothetical protein
MSFNTFSRLAASIDTRIFEMSLSVSFGARSLQISLKSSVSDSKHAGRDNAKAMIARDEFGRYSPTKRKIDSGRQFVDRQLLLMMASVLLPELPQQRLLLMVRIIPISLFVNFGITTMIRIMVTVS